MRSQDRALRGKNRSMHVTASILLIRLFYVLINLLPYYAKVVEKLNDKIRSFSPKMGMRTPYARCLGTLQQRGGVRQFRVLGARAVPARLAGGKS